MQIYLIIPDLHVPYHDLSYVRLISRVITFLKPDGIVQLGDALDFWQVSRFEKDPSRKNTIYDDLKTYRSIMMEWESLMPKDTFFYQLEGNHEHRLTRYIWNHAKEISEITKTVPEILFERDDHRKGIERQFYPLNDWKACQIGDCVLHHGIYYNAHVAVGNMTKYPTKFICGHTHRFQFVSNGDKFSCSLGHGSDEQYTAHSPVPSGWQQCFGILYNNKEITTLEPILVSNSRCIIWGREFYGAQK